MPPRLPPVPDFQSALFSPPLLSPTLPPTSSNQQLSTPAPFPEPSRALILSSPAVQPFQPLILPQDIILLPPELASGVTHPQAKRDAYAADTQKYIDAALHYQQARLLLVCAFPLMQEQTLFNRASWCDAQRLTDTWYSWAEEIGTYVSQILALNGS